MGESLDEIFRTVVTIRVRHGIVELQGEWQEGKHNLAGQADMVSERHRPAFELQMPKTTVRVWTELI